MGISDFHFLRPAWLLALIPLALLLWRLLRADSEGSAWRGVVDAHLLPALLSFDEGVVRPRPLVLLGLGWLLMVLALAGPTWQRLPQPLYEARQFRVIALDLSPSMNATDLAPSRLARARFEVLDLLRQSEEGQTALLAYGAEPFVVAPLTTDVATIAAQVPSLDTGLLPVQGPRRTDLVLDSAAGLLHQADAPDGQVILVTDGLDHADAAVAAAGRLAADGYRVFVLGVGTDRGGPVAGPDGGLLKDEQGVIRLPRLDVEALRRLADAGGGRYVGATPDDRDMDALKPGGVSRSGDKADPQQSEADQWREAGPWLLLLLLPLAALAFRRGWVGPLLLLLWLAPPPDAYALGWDDLWLRPDQRAARLMEKGQASEAAQLFDRPDWRAAAQYQADDYAQAVQSLQGLPGAESDYNRGNALARLGQLDDALAAYDRVLAQAPDHADARHNRDLVQRLLDQRRQQEGQAERRDADQGEQGGEGQQAQAGSDQEGSDKETGESPQTQQQSGARDSDSTASSSAQREAGDAAGAQPQPSSGQDDSAGQGAQQAESAGAGQGRDGAQSAAGGRDAPSGSDQEAGGSPSGTHQADDKGPDGEQDRPQANTAERDGGDDGHRESAQPDARVSREQQAGSDAQAHGRAGPGSDTPERAGGRDGGPADTAGSGSAQAHQVDPTGVTDPRDAGAGSAAPEPGAGGQSPGLADLLGRQPQVADGTAATAQAPGIDPEDRQAIEQLLRRVEDDPAGLLRQRFLLQHLRRRGQLP